MFGLGILGILFSVFNYFKNPQIDQDKRDALLAQQVNWQNESTDRRFKEMQESFNALLLQSNNHIHTVDTKVDKVNEGMTSMSNEITKLATIIQERIPKK
jgi:hypothetical protein